MHQSLRIQGCNTYKIYHQSGSIYLYDHATFQSSVITKVHNSTQHQTPEQILQNRISYIVNKLRKENKDNVTLSQVSHQFKLDHKQSITEALKGSNLSKSALKFIQTSCSKTIIVKQKNNIHYLNLVNK